MSTVTSDNLDDLGRKLYRLNAMAVNGRYGVKDFEVPIFHYRPMAWALIDHYQALKSIQCLHYQMCEEGIEDKPLTKALEALSNKIAMFLATDDFRYKSCVWDSWPAAGQMRLVASFAKGTARIQGKRATA